MHTITIVTIDVTTVSDCRFCACETSKLYPDTPVSVYEHRQRGRIPSLLLYVGATPQETLRHERRVFRLLYSYRNGECVLDGPCCLPR